MARRKLHNRNIRKITKLAGGSSYGIKKSRQEANNRGLGEIAVLGVGINELSK